MAFLSRFITIFVFLAALQTGLAAPPCRQKHAPPTVTPPQKDVNNTTPVVEPPPMVNPTPPKEPIKDVNSTTPTKPGSASSDIQTFLQAHNSIRSQHGAAPLVWSDMLAEKAQQWAANCEMVHSGGKLGHFGG